MADRTAVVYDLIFNTQSAAEDIASLNAQLKTANDNFSKTSGAAATAARTVAQTGKAFSGARQSIQNASFQVADFATQVSGGTNVTRALAQQLPQMVAGFGALGAGLGAAIAILLPLAEALGKTRDYAKELEDGVKKLKDAQEVSRKSVAELTEEYGKHAWIIRDIAITQEKLASDAVAKSLQDQAQAALELNSNSIGTASALGEMVNQLRNLDFGRSAIGQLIQPLDDAASKTNFLKDRFGLTEEAARGVVKPLFDFQAAIAALNTDDAAKALAELDTWIKSNNAEAAQANVLLEGMRKQYDALAKIRPPVTSPMGFGFTPATPANTYVNNGGENAVANQLRALEEQQKALKKAQDAAAKSAREEQQAFDQFANAIDRGVTPLQRAQSQLNTLKEEFARFHEQLTPEQITAYNAVIDELNQKITDLTFKDKWKDMAEGIQSVTTPLSELYDQIQQIGTTIADSLATGLADAFGAFIDGTKSAQQAFKEFAVNFLKQITAMIIKSLILYAIQTALGAVGGGGGIGSLLGGSLNPIQSAKGNVFAAGRLQKFATGGIVTRPTVFPMSNGGTGLMGEAGPEAIVPLTRRNGKLGVEAAAPVINVHNYAGAEVSTKRNAAGELDIVIQAVASAIARGGTPIDSAIARGYGLRRAGR